MRARLIALIALGIVVALTITGLKVADSTLETQYRAYTPQVDPTNDNNPVQEGAQAPGDQDAQFDPVQPASDIITWEAENNYLMRDNVIRLGWGPSLSTQPIETRLGEDEAAEDTNKATVHILSVGDSFVWGQAVEDLDMRWPQVLERTLNTQGSAETTYAVTPLGRTGVSLMQMADWINPERLAEINPDIVVLGYLNNDIIPTFEETNLCNQYGTCTQDGDMPVSWNPKNDYLVDCLKGQDSALGFLLRTTINPYFPYVGRWLTNRYCDPDRIAAGDVELQEGKWIDNPSESPYWSSVEESIERLGRNLNGTPTIVFDYWGILQPGAKQERIRDLFQAQGFTIVGLTETEKLLAATEDERQLEINPGDGHPGAELTHAYAADIAEGIRQLAVTATRREPARGRTAVSNYLPSTLKVTSSTDNFSLRGGPYSPETLEALRQSDSVFHRWDLSQETACARMGRPHARIMLNPYLDNYTLTLTADPGTPPLVVMPVGYDNDGAAVEGKPQLLSETNTLTIDMGANYRGILIGTTKAGCEPGQVKLPVMSIRGTLEPN